jgi:UDP-MurNAc hydroxylase
MTIRVTYYYSACVAIETPDFRIVCDPWFTDGAYDGSWFQFPKLERPLEKLGQADFIYVSHIHPDHYDPVFLRQYLERYPGTRILIARFLHPHLHRKMLGDGFEPEALNELGRGDSNLHIIPNEAEDSPDPSDIDSALVVRWQQHAVVNMNDNVFNAEQIAKIVTLCPQPQLALLGYTGAGPYPQTYHEPGKQLHALAEAKKQQFFQRYRELRDALRPQIAVPFAGKYLLGGKLAELNVARGVADAVEVLAFDRDAVVLDDGGDASIDTATLTPTRARTRPYAEADLARAIDAVAERPMAYETLMPYSSVPALPLRRLADKAYRNALRYSLCEENYFFCLSTPDGWLVLNANRERPLCESRQVGAALYPRSEVNLDPRHLFGLLTGVYHWNNAEVGSHLRVRRHPDKLNRPAQRFLNFLAV